MRTLDLAAAPISIVEILQFARKEALLLKTSSGESFFLSLADDFKNEVELLRSHRGFIAFLDKAKKVTETLSLAEIEQKHR